MASNDVNDEYGEILFTQSAEQAVIQVINYYYCVWQSDCY